MDVLVEVVGWHFHIQSACRYNGWVTELQHEGSMRDVSRPHGIDNLLYSADAAFSCFADLAVVSPEDYKLEGQGSLMQCVLTPADPYMPLSNQEIADATHQQVFGHYM